SRPPCTTDRGLTTCWLVVAPVTPRWRAGRCPAVAPPSRRAPAQPPGHPAAAAPPRRRLVPGPILRHWTARPFLQVHAQVPVNAADPVVADDEPVAAAPHPRKDRAPAQTEAVETQLVTGLQVVDA